MQWNSEIAHPDGVIERSFVIRRGDRSIPGTMWCASWAVGPQPLVLLGHGGSSHANGEPIVKLAHNLACHERLISVAIDGPVHGLRRVDPQADRAIVQQDFRAFWREGDGGREQMAADWIAVVDALVGVREIDNNAIGWHGLSMGTAYGLPLCAREARICAAVMGAWSADYPNSQTLTDYAQKVRAKVLFVHKWEDEFMSREGAMLLFSALGTRAKQLNVYPGKHADTTPDQLEDVIRFLAKELRNQAYAARQKSA